MKIHNYGNDYAYQTEKYLKEQKQVENVATDKTEKPEEPMEVGVRREAEADRCEENGACCEGQSEEGCIEGEAEQPAQNVTATAKRKKANKRS